jgi:guanylate kinase
VVRLNWPRHTLTPANEAVGIMSIEGEIRRFFLVLGPSGVGKTTIIQLVRARIPTLGYPVSFTTRQRRPGEEEGESYHFLSSEEFRRLRDSGALLEWDQPHGTHYYGIPAESVVSALTRGETLIREVAYRGLEQILNSPVSPWVFSVFLAPDSLDSLRSRISDRGDDSEIQNRIGQATEELAYAKRCDRVITVAEGGLDQAANELEGIIRAVSQVSESIN